MSANNTFRPRVESLEAREVPAGFTGGFSNGVLTINGTSGNDTISLTQSGDQVRLTGYTNVWSAGQIRNIVVNAGAGNDTVSLGVNTSLATKSYVDGGTGTDT